MSIATDAFARAMPFGLDPFQREACEAIEAGSSVLVAAPTGAGKTVVAEFAIHLTMEAPTGRVFYTTPMKALSNQKHRELTEVYGSASVGLLTGDTSINGDARIVVMTTEVLRNMLYEGRDLSALEYVVMDEVHYLADRFRGAVWEEVIIHLPRHVRLVSLSATVSNAEEFGAWLDAVRGDTRVIVSEHRPVPLDAHVHIRGRLVDLFDSKAAEESHRPSRELVELARGGDVADSAAHGHRDRGGHNRYRSRRPPKGGRRPAPPGRGGFGGRVDRVALIAMLDEREMLPAIDFIFSRAGCDAAVRQVVEGGVRLTTPEDRAEIRAIVDERCRLLDDADLGVLGYFDWLDGLERGVAAHHAGLLPVFKEVVEELFRARLVKVVFATETLALGINMPARTVVLEQLEKFNGEARVRITPGEYTQLTGRAGRRGIDTEGHGVVIWNGALQPVEVASLASRRTYPLHSSFRPTYNMAVNLVDRLGVVGTREVLETSFAQFQADRSVVQLARRVVDQRESLTAYESSMTCHLGDFSEYAELRREASELERDDQRQGVSHGDHERNQRRLKRLRAAMRAHPCHACPEREQHARWGERYWRLRRDIEKAERQIERRTGQIAQAFDRIAEILRELGYLERTEHGERVSAAGDMLRRIYGERDLLTAESLRRGLWSGLDAPALAAIACALVYEGRRDDGMLPERMLPKGPFLDALDATQRLWAQLDDLEQAHRMPGTEPLQTGLTLAMHRWARGYPLEHVLRDTELAAGDFVRWTKQTIDVLEQLEHVAPKRLARTAAEAVDRIRRGVVEASGSAL
ncbi:MULTISPECIES: RNA helicase [unclassified Agrococcus]|uniref:DEAD/DEAH box helicase n=1 Tax=unclassified Agrococcus TaxID=2615065 RepID=UPI001FF1CD0B|nr:MULTISPECIES: DEAD/DEAH box helicase [unclassified Agrococcus]MDR7234717.1 ATP-dependent RNA helicase HelY [Agrococcus sp. BE272]UOW00417.1 DEAD/DEAH box helicase [Agrococcus sp. SCSIO52902]